MIVKIFGKEVTLTELESEFVEVFTSTALEEQRSMWLGEFYSGKKETDQRMNGVITSLKKKNVLDVNIIDGGLLTLMIDDWDDSDFNNCHSPI
tara:strand:- start:277 stop:555 length:279 start_codon:yes stop_codon:yes gene_type:complete